MTIATNKFLHIKLEVNHAEPTTYQDSCYPTKLGSGWRNYNPLHIILVYQRGLICRLEPIIFLQRPTTSRVQQCYSL